MSTSKSPPADGAPRETPRFDVLIVGGGHAGTQLVTELLQAGFEGTIAVIESQARPPYERPPLSKAVLRGEVDHTSLDLRAESFWVAPNVNLFLGENVVEVDPERRVVTTDVGEAREYGSLVWAAGGRPRQLPLPEAPPDGLRYLATIDDALSLRESIKPGLHIVIVGGGFIGLEAAAACAEAKLDVTVVEREERLLARVTGHDISEYFRGLHERHGVGFRLGVSLEGLVIEDGRATGVVLDSGEKLPADLILVAVGLVPNVEPLRRAGVSVTDGVDIDPVGRTSVPHVYAIGDNARFAIPGRDSLRLECINNANEQARVLAAQLRGVEGPLMHDNLPWFWSHQYDTKFRSVGIVPGHDGRVVRGDPTTDSFSVVYVRDGAVAAVDCVNAVKDFVAAKKVVGLQVDVTGIDDPARPLLDAVLVKPAGAVPPS